MGKYFGSRPIVMLLACGLLIPCSARASILLVSEAYGVYSLSGSVEDHHAYLGPPYFDPTSASLVAETFHPSARGRAQQDSLFATRAGVPSLSWAGLITSSALAEIEFSPPPRDPGRLLPFSRDWVQLDVRFELSQPELYDLSGVLSLPTPSTVSSSLFFEFAGPYGPPFHLDGQSGQSLDFHAQGTLYPGLYTITAATELLANNVGLVGTPTYTPIDASWNFELDLTDAPQAAAAVPEPHMLFEVGLLALGAFGGYLRRGPAIRRR